MAKKLWPVVAVPDGRGGVLIRWYAGRDDALRAVRKGGDDDVMYIDVNGVRIEVSFHESPAAARKACDREIARGRFAKSKPVGNA